MALASGWLNSCDRCTFSAGGSCLRHGWRLRRPKESTCATWRQAEGDENRSARLQGVASCRKLGYVVRPHWMPLGVRGHEYVTIDEVMMIRPRPWLLERLAALLA